MPEEQKCEPSSTAAPHKKIKKSIVKKKQIKPKQKTIIKKSQKVDTSEGICPANPEYINEIFKIEDLNDLINIIENREINNLDYIKLNNIYNEIKELNNMIGLQNIKKTIAKQIIYSIQNLSIKNNEYHTVLTGAPGCGKTEIAKILGKIYLKLSESKYGIFKKVSRSDLVGQFLGDTAIKTQNCIDSCENGVLFIDEIYSLGTGDRNKKVDSFAKEAVDTLVNNLIDGNFICIIAGYARETQEMFFDINKGLDRRFPWKYDISNYTEKELSQIFINQIYKEKWDIENGLNDYLIYIIKKNKNLFSNSGGDTANLFTNIKISHSLRVFCHDINIKKLINKDDITKGLELFLLQKENELSNNNNDIYMKNSMYS